jgi:hypothetical protein
MQRYCSESFSTSFRSANAPISDLFLLTKQKMVPVNDLYVVHFSQIIYGQLKVYNYQHMALYVCTAF